MADVQSPTSPDDRHPFDGWVNKKKVAACHRALQFSFLATILLFVLLVAVILRSPPSVPFSIRQIPYFAFLGAWYWTAIQASRLKYAMGENLFFSLLFGALFLIPIVCLIALVFVHWEAAALLRRAGLRIGFLGVRAKDVDRCFSPWLCHWCDYDLTGNRSGTCPECGNRIPASMQPILADRETSMIGVDPT